jgi:hypothetical protein
MALKIIRTDEDKKRKGRIIRSKEKRRRIIREEKRRRGEEQT